MGEAGEESVLELEESESTSGGAGAEIDLLIYMLSRSKGMRPLGGSSTKSQESRVSSNGQITVGSIFERNARLECSVMLSSLCSSRKVSESAR